MNKRQRDDQGRAIRWIDTRYARPYKQRQAIRAARAATITALANAHIAVIRSAPVVDSSPGVGLHKTVAMLEVTVNASAAIKKLYDGERCKNI